MAITVNQAVTCKEVTEVITKIVRISGKSKPLSLGTDASGKAIPNTENVVFLRAFDAETGDKINSPLSISESRAKAFGFSKLLINPDNATKDNNGGTIEELNTLENQPLYFECSLRVIPDGKIGDWGYKTKKALTVNGVSYNAGDIVPYRSVNTLIIESVGREFSANDFKSAGLESANARADAAGDMAYRTTMFTLIYRRNPNMSNDDDVNKLLNIPLRK